MENIENSWSLDKNALIKFFKDSPRMDIHPRMKYFHEVFPYAEILPMNFYLFDSDMVNLACNQTTLNSQGDESLNDYLGFNLREYGIRKRWPEWMHISHLQNNQAAVQKRQVIAHEFSKQGCYAKQWLSKKEGIFGDNGEFLGIIGISLLTELGSKAISWDTQTKKIKLSVSDEQTIHFTEREFKVLQGLLNGGTAQEIADSECISDKTVETYIMRIKQKFNCQKQREIIALLIQNELAKEIAQFSK